MSRKKQASKQRQNKYTVKTCCIIYNRKHIYRIKNACQIIGLELVASYKKWSDSYPFYHHTGYLCTYHKTPFVFFIIAKNKNPCFGVLIQSSEREHNKIPPSDNKKYAATCCFNILYYTRSKMDRGIEQNTFSVPSYIITVGTCPVNKT